MTYVGLRRFDDERERVEQMMCTGEFFSTVEDQIARAPLPADQQAALWLVAWSLGDRPVWQRGPKLQLARSDGH